MKTISLIIAALLVSACTLQVVTGDDNDVVDSKEPKPTIEAPLPFPTDIIKRIPHGN
jgi:hypothetical protein